MRFFIICLACLIGVSFAAVAKKSRTIEQKPLSDEEPGTKEYDHEAFLGEEEAKTFDELPEEESVRRLGIIADRLDANKDGKVDKEELKVWIKKAQTRYVEEDADTQMKASDTNGNGHLEWSEYYQNTYGHISDDDLNRDEEEHGFSYKRMIRRDEKRWKTADDNADSSLTREELMAFLHPEEYPKMREIVLDETIEDIDKDKDGFVNKEEYIGDMWREEDGSEEPEWVKTEREQFSNIRDVDKDGKLNREEMRSWILPDEYDAIDAEASHLVYEADDNKDEVLTKEEILQHHSTFVGSQITNWGDDLKRHDEF